MSINVIINNTIFKSVLFDIWQSKLRPVLRLFVNGIMTKLIFTLVCNKEMFEDKIKDYLFVD